MADEHPPADALVLVAPGCPHCPQVVSALADLLKQDRLGRLEIVNIARHPEVAAAVGTRSVPWTRIGPFELAGNYRAAELAEWAGYAAQGSGMSLYLAHLLEQQALPQVIARVEAAPALAVHLVALLADLDTPMGVRIGVGAVLEHFEGTDVLTAIVPELGALTRAAEVQIRADAAHYLGLSHSVDARPWLEPLRDDPDAEVQEIAVESLALLP